MFTQLGDCEGCVHSDDHMQPKDSILSFQGLLQVGWDCDKGLLQK